MLQIQHSKKNGFIMIYGFKTESHHYDVVMTLHIKPSTTMVYGFLSRIKLSISDLKKLWSYIKNVVPTKYLTIEVLPEHAPLYKHFLDVVEKRKTRTFNGFPSEILKIRLK